ncbi:integrase, catalytic region, zinc finger, CCHC-type containing protein [Tanacetum coccineum]
MLLTPRTVNSRLFNCKDRLLGSDEYHEVHEMQTDEQHNYVVDSDADYTSNSNIIPYDQYMEDNEDHVVQRNVSSVRNDALMSILDEMHEQGVQSRLANKPDMVVNDSVTSELARYKELVGEYEKRAKFELTDRERKIDEQMRIIISDRNRKETSLKSELHSAQILLSSTVDHYKSKTEEVTLLKKDFKQKEDKFLEEFLDIKKLKDKIEDRLYKQDQSVQTVHMLCKPKSFYDEKHKVAIGYKNPLCLTRAKQTQSALYNGHVLVTTNHTPTVIHDSEDTRELAEITRNRMLLKMQSPLLNDSTYSKRMQSLEAIQMKNRIPPAKKENKKEVEVLLRTNKYWFIKDTHRRNSPLGKTNLVYQWRPHRKDICLRRNVHLTKLSVKSRTVHAMVSGLRLFKTYDGNRFNLMNFVEKFIGSVKFRNDHLGAIMGNGDLCYGDICLQSKLALFVAILKGKEHTEKVAVAQFVQKSIEEMISLLPICLLSKASKSKSWLWHPSEKYIHKSIDDDIQDSHRYIFVYNIAQDAPVDKCFIDYIPISIIHSNIKKFAEEPTHEDTPINHDVLHPSHNPVSGDPDSVQSSSGNVNSAEPIQVTYPPDHLRRWTKDHPLDNIVLSIPLVLTVQSRTQELQNGRDKDCWIQAMQNRFAPDTKRPSKYSMPMLQPRNYHTPDGCQKTAYLKGDLQEEVPVSFSLKDMKTRKTNARLSLKKALYGLKQAPRTWYDTLSKFLLANNFFKREDPHYSPPNQANIFYCSNIRR